MNKRLIKLVGTGCLSFLISIPTFAGCYGYTCGPGYYAGGSCGSSYCGSDCGEGYCGNRCGGWDCQCTDPNCGSNGCLGPGTCCEAFGNVGGR